MDVKLTYRHEWGWDWRRHQRMGGRLSIYREDGWRWCHTFRIFLREILDSSWEGNWVLKHWTIQHLLYLSELQIAKFESVGRSASDLSLGTRITGPKLHASGRGSWSTVSVKVFQDLKPIPRRRCITVRLKSQYLPEEEIVLVHSPQPGFYISKSSLSTFR